jgi:hypothetical protein
MRTYFGSPPFEPRPSQYWGPPPSIIDPGAPWIVTLLPAIWIGLNWELFVNSKLVVPEKVTEAPVFSLVRIIALLAGAWILSNVRDMHAATAGEIWDHAVQRHGVGVVVVTEIDADELVFVADEWGMS